MLAKYEFTIPSDDTEFSLKVETPSDKYLHSFLRLKIVDRSPSSESDLNKNECSKVTLLNSLTIDSMRLPVN